VIIAAIAVVNFLKFRAWKKCKLDFTGKRCFITGGSSGIGEELTKQLILLGAKEVIIASRKVAEMERVKSECKHPERVSILELDLSKPEESLKKV
jgi:short-subunit dehydrogenase